MKKRMLALAMVMGCAFTFPTVSYAEENTDADVEEEVGSSAETDADANSDEEEDSNVGTLHGVWMIDQAVDEFGDKVEGENPVLKTPITGDFSNTATSKAKLSGVLFAQKVSQKIVLAFRLLEYGSSQATYLSSEEDEIILKTKVGDEVKSFDLFGSAPNGDLYLGALNEDGNWLADTLCSGTDIKCVIYIGNSKYNFTVSGNGFAEACTECGYSEVVSKNKLSTSAATLYEYMKNHEEEFLDNYYQHEYYKDADHVINIAAAEESGVPYVALYEDYYYDQDDKTQRFIIFLHEAGSSVQFYSQTGSEEMDGNVKITFEPATFEQDTTLTQYFDLEGNPKDVTDTVVEYWNTHNAALLDAFKDYLTTTDCDLTLEDFGFVEESQGEVAETTLEEATENANSKISEWNETNLNFYQYIPMKSNEGYFNIILLTEDDTDLTEKAIEFAVKEVYDELKECFKGHDISVGITVAKSADEILKLYSDDELAALD